MASGCVRVDSTKKKSKKKSGGASGLASLSVTPGLIFVTFFFRLRQQREFRCRGLRDTRSPNPLSFLLAQHGNTPVWRLEERPPPFAGGRSAYQELTRRHHFTFSHWHRTMAGGDVRGRATDGSDSPVAVGWSERARAMALQTVTGWLWLRLRTWVALATAIGQACE